MSFIHPWHHFKRHIGFSYAHYSATFAFSHIVKFYGMSLVAHHKQQTKIFN